MIDIYEVEWIDASGTGHSTTFEVTKEGALQRDEFIKVIAPICRALDCYRVIKSRIVIKR